MTRKGVANAGACPRCGATKSHQKYPPHKGVRDIGSMWPISETDPVDGVVCQRCGFGFRVSHLEHDGTYFENLLEEGDSTPAFCPRCGARMEGSWE